MIDSVNFQPESPHVQNSKEQSGIQEENTTQNKDLAPSSLNTETDAPSALFGVASVDAEKQDIPQSPASMSPSMPVSTANERQQFERRIQQALALKNAGNQQFKSGYLDEAKDFYQQALQQLNPQQLMNANIAECQKIYELSANLLFNIGQCFFYQQQWRQAVLMYNEALTINPQYGKALYRRALAQYEQQLYKQAMDDIKIVFAQDRRNAEVHEAYERILVKYNEQVAQERENLKQLSTKIFSRSSPSKGAKKQQQDEDKNEEGVNWWGMGILSILVVGGALAFKYLKK